MSTRARSAIRVLNDQIAKHAAIGLYLRWYEAHAEAEQLAVESGEYTLAEQHHGAVLTLLKALDAEQLKPLDLDDEGTVRE